MKCQINVFSGPPYHEGIRISLTRGNITALSGGCKAQTSWATWHENRSKLRDFGAGIKENFTWWKELLLFWGASHWLSVSMYLLTSLIRPCMMSLVFHLSTPASAWYDVAWFPVEISPGVLTCCVGFLHLLPMALVPQSLSHLQEPWLPGIASKVACILHLLLSDPYSGQVFYSITCEMYLRSRVGGYPATDAIANLFHMVVHMKWSSFQLLRLL